MTGTPTTAKLKHDINRGRGGDKVDAIDPAAAPLGTDEEAAGTPPSRQAIKQAHAHEIGAKPVSSERNDSNHGVVIYLAAVAAVVLVVATGNLAQLDITALRRRSKEGRGTTKTRPM